MLRERLYSEGHLYLWQNTKPSRKHLLYSYIVVHRSCGLPQKYMHGDLVFFTLHMPNESVRNQ